MAGVFIQHSSVFFEVSQADLQRRCAGSLSSVTERILHCRFYPQNVSIKTETWCRLHFWLLSVCLAPFCCGLSDMLKSCDTHLGQDNPRSGSGITAMSISRQSYQPSFLVFGFYEPPSQMNEHWEPPSKCIFILFPCRQCENLCIIC